MNSPSTRLNKLSEELITNQRALHATVHASNLAALRMRARLMVRLEEYNALVAAAAEARDELVANLDANRSRDDTAAEESLVSWLAIDLDPVAVPPVMSFDLFSANQHGEEIEDLIEADEMRADLPY